METLKSNLKSQKAITLVALVVTIVVLLILAGITIVTVFSDNGILKSAQDAVKRTKIAEVKDKVLIDVVAKKVEKDGEDITQRELKDILVKYAKGGENGIIEKDGKITGIEIEGVNGVISIAEIYTGSLSEEDTTVDLAMVITTEHETLKAKDSYGNIVTVPKGFKVVTKREDESIVSTGDVPTVPEGVVLQDRDGNQFVWIPVGKVYKDVDHTEENTKNIVLGRYNFDVNGAQIEAQLATNYQEEIGLYPFYSRW